MCITGKRQIYLKGNGSNITIKQELKIYKTSCLYEDLCKTKKQKTHWITLMIRKLTVILINLGMKLAC